MNATLTIRPEQRRRSSAVEAAAWADTVPAFFRSEAFAEDLAEPVAAAATQPRRHHLARGGDQPPAAAAQSAR